MSPFLAPLVLAASLSPTPDQAPAEPPAGPSVASKLALSGAYYGETITHPGVAVGMEYYAFESRRYKLIVAPKVGIYLHHRTHGAAFVDAELGHRVTAKFGLYGDLFTGIGYMHTWPWGDVYGRAADGSVEKQFNAGSPHVKFGGGLGLGWDLSKNGVAPISIFARLEMFGEAPFNTGIAVHGALMCGVIWRFGRGKELRK